MERRQFIGRFALMAGALGTGVLGGTAFSKPSELAMRYHADSILGDGEPQKLWYRHRIIDQPVMDTQLMFWLGLAPTGLTDIGEVLDTATRIQVKNEKSWFDAWFATAQRVQEYGDLAFGEGHQMSAASNYYRAGAYYRAGLMRYPDHRDPRMKVATKEGLRLHDLALNFKGVDSHEVKIPYENGFLFGRMHYSPNVKKAKTIILHQGLHAWPEDTMWIIDGALARGYHVLSFHGPGQGASLRLYGHTFRHDWEVPVSKVVDFVIQDGRVDENFLILMGLSFGGYLAGRAASYDHRFRALVVNPGVLSWADSMLRHFRNIPGIMGLHAQGPDMFDGAIDAVSSVMPDARWYFDDVTWKHGVATPHALIEDLKKYDNKKGAPKIKCQTLIMDGSAEDASPGESQRFYEALTCKKHLMTFDATTASQVHCQGGNTIYAQGRLFDWLDEEIK